jgi:hypothetical protein
VKFRCFYAEVSSAACHFKNACTKSSRVLGYLCVYLLDEIDVVLLVGLQDSVCGTALRDQPAAPSLLLVDHLTGLLQLGWNEEIFGSAGTFTRLKVWVENRTGRVLAW